MEDYYEETERRAPSRGLTAALTIMVAGFALYGAYAIFTGLI